MHNKFFVVVAGPTAVGKTDFAVALAHHIGGEIINADVGQFYTPLTIGTAKPPWQSMIVPHHFFDILSEPAYYNIVHYRHDVQRVMQQIWLRGNIPVVVGGSTLYIKALYYSLPEAVPLVPKKYIEPTWENLYSVDPERALAIAKKDRYRIERALTIWSTQGIKPSAIKEQFAPLAPSYFINLQRPRSLLYERINQRTELMLKEGWLDEVKALEDTPWIPFLQQKKLIGYPDIIDFLAHKISYRELVETIQKKTRNYAKRQCTFLRMLEQKLRSQTALYEHESMVTLW